MKYNTGDCLSFAVSTGEYLSGFISETRSNKYQIALLNHLESIPPSPKSFDNCEVFGVRYEIPGNSISSLDVIVMEPEFVDSSDNIERISHLKVAGFLSASGFTVVSNLNDMLVYFKTSMPLRSQADQMFEIKCFVNLNDFLKSTELTNTFPAVTLYKKESETIFYWMIYGNSNNPVYLVIHWGKLRENGEHIEMKDKPVAHLQEVYRTQIDTKKKDGYSEDFKMNNMILQFPVGDGWGNEDDLDFRNEMWDYLDRFLFWSGNGCITGGDIGAGSINLFFDALLPELSVDIINSALLEKKIERPYLIAIEEGEVKDGEMGVRVVHPKAYEGEFFY